MGCYSVACSISKLSINHGDKCVIIPIFKNPFDEQYGRKAIGSPCDRCLPLTLPIVGYYDDYGGIEYIEKNENTEIIEKYFGISIEDFIQCILYNEYDKVKDESKKKILEKTYFMYVLYDVYAYSCCNFRNLSYKKEKEVVKEFHSNIQKCNEMFFIYSEGSKYHTKEEFYDLVLTAMRYHIEDLLPFYCARGFHYNNEYFKNIYLSTVFNGKTFYNPSDFMLKEFVDFYYFIMSMIYTNSIFDIVRQGTQCGDVEIELQNAKMYCFILESRRRDME